MHGSRKNYLKPNLRKQYNSEKTCWISEFKIMTGHQKSSKIMHYNSYKYFRRPIVPFLVSQTQNMDIPVRFNHEILSDIVTNAQKQCYAFSPKSDPYKNVGTQTDYRDSESQTVPWEPPYKIKSGYKPEVLSIAHLTWNHGLQIGLHELEVINRMRRKREWEKTLPPMDTSASIKKRAAMINAMEVDEWAFRESEIQSILNYRQELMDEITKSREYKKQESIQDRFDRLVILLSTRRDKEINSIRHKLRRELRKLYKRHQEKNKPFKRDIIKEHADPSSQLYAPQMRYGEHPQRRHEVIQKDLLGESFIECTTEISTLPRLLSTYEELSAIKSKSKPADICVRATRWTKEKLSQLHSDLKAIKGKPKMYEGRDRCRELIEEMKTSFGLEKHSKKQYQKDKEQTLDLQHIRSDKSMQEDRLCEILNSLEGMTISGMLDFLSKELVRLEDERRIHASALLVERERAIREATEAGRRQLEYCRRREFDEMFRQIVKVNQESVECYLEDIIKESTEWVSDEAAKAYILKLCDKVDSIARDIQTNTRLTDEEMVANMVYNFMLPEVEKNAMRKNIREKQQIYLQNAHTAIYKEILNLPSIKDANLVNTIYEEEPYKTHLITNQDIKQISKKCSAIYVTETELKSVYASVLCDIEAIMEDIISNVIKMI
ncbi:unnamed protein product [Xylocopa violacea]|uniref:Cilia- and flagella-associated protein 91 n=2 Tax=Xylocopa violacea TaxID=135666 RepID=A0ABP1NZ94_XYLVO